MSVFSDPEKITRILNQNGYQSVDQEYRKLLQNKQVHKTPRFYFQKHEQYVSVIINYLSSLKSLEYLKETLPTREDLNLFKSTYESLNANSFNSLTRISTNKILRYTEYLQIKGKMPERLSSLLTTKLFIEIGGNSISNCNYNDLIRYLENIVNCVENYSYLRKLDIYRTGFITEDDFKDYIYHFAKDFTFLNGEKLIQNYIIFAANRFLIILDPLKTGKISIDMLIHNPLYSCFISCNNWCLNEKMNPFGINVFKRVLNGFNKLDLDGDGLLQKNDLLLMDNYRLTSAFINSIYDNCCSNGIMDFECYVRFRASLDGLGHRWANLYIFDAIDIDKSGDITMFEINYFQKEIEKSFKDLLRNKNIESNILNINSIICEKFDILQVKDERISKDVFVNSKSSESFVRQLIDMNSIIESNLFQIE